jgi:superfamily II DNA helicase RecQ
VDYSSLGVLREAFSHIPFLGLTATMTPTAISYFFKSVRFKRPTIIKQTVRRTNVDIWVASIVGKEYEDLRVLFSHGISSAEDIPQTIIFYSGRVGCGRMAKWLRSQLPAALRSESETIIRNYNGVLDERSKEETLELLRSGACRMVACTDAFGLGMNLKAIPRVVVWKLDSKLGIDGLHQRIGRAGRDSNARALALIFVTNANLSGQYISPKVTMASVDRAKEKKAKQTKTKNSKGTLPSEIQSSTADNDEFQYTLPICTETEPIFRKALLDIYAAPTKKALISHSESNLVHAIHWVVQTEGCRQKPFLVAFDDTEMMTGCEIPGGCDRCLMNHLMETNQVDSPPSLHGIPFTITLTYQTYLQTSVDKPRKKRKAAAYTISTNRMDKLVADIKSWREKNLQHIAKRFAGMSVEVVFPDDEIVALAGKAKYVRSEDDLIVAVKECGYGIPASWISTYTKDLYHCICESLKESHPPTQLQEQFQQAAGRTSTQSTPSIPPYQQPRNRLHPSVATDELAKHTATPQVPRWPIPSIISIPLIAQRVPLAEKHHSDTGISMNVPAEQLVSGDNARRSTRRSMCRRSRLPTFSSASSDPICDHQNNLSTTKNRCKRDSPGDENSVNQIPTGKKHKSKQIQ